MLSSMRSLVSMIFASRRRSRRLHATWSANRPTLSATSPYRGRFSVSNFETLEARQLLAVTASVSVDGLSLVISMDADSDFAYAQVFTKDLIQVATDFAFNNVVGTFPSMNVIVQETKSPISTSFTFRPGLGLTHNLTISNVETVDLGTSVTGATKVTNANTIATNANLTGSVNFNAVNDISFNAKVASSSLDVRSTDGNITLAADVSSNSFVYLSTQGSNATSFSPTTSRLKTAHF